MASGASSTPTVTARASEPDERPAPAPAPRHAGEQLGDGAEGGRDPPAGVGAGQQRRRPRHRRHREGVEAARQQRRGEEADEQVAAQGRPVVAEQQPHRPLDGERLEGEHLGGHARGAPAPGSRNATSAPGGYSSGKSRYGTSPRHSARPSSHESIGASTSKGAMTNSTRSTIESSTMARKMSGFASQRSSPVTPWSRSRRTAPRRAGSWAPPSAPATSTSTTSTPSSRPASRAPGCTTHDVGLDAVAAQGVDVGGDVVAGRLRRARAQVAHQHPAGGGDVERLGELGDDGGGQDAAVQRAGAEHDEVGGGDGVEGQRPGAAASGSRRTCCDAGGRLDRDLPPHRGAVGRSSATRSTAVVDAGRTVTCSGMPRRAATWATAASRSSPSSAVEGGEQQVAGGVAVEVATGEAALERAGQRAPRRIGERGEAPPQVARRRQAGGGPEAAGAAAVVGDRHDGGQRPGPRDAGPQRDGASPCPPPTATTACSSALTGTRSRWVTAGS